MARKRTIKKNFWFNEEEENKLRQIVKATGKNESELIRDFITGKSIKEKPQEEFYIAIKELRMLSRYLGSLLQNGNTNIDSLKIKEDITKIDLFILDIKRKFLI